MRSDLHRLLAIAALMPLGACGAQTGGLSAGFNPSLYSVHQPVVQQASYALDLATEGDLPHAEGQRLRAWFDALQLGFGDRVSVQTGDEGARIAVANAVAQYGLLIEAAAPTDLPYGTTRVIVARASASVSSCPDWRHSGQPGAPITTDSNYGCATNSNLAAMIADPNDLVRGRTGHAIGDIVRGRTNDEVYDLNGARTAAQALRDRPPSGASGQLPASTAQGGGASSSEGSPQ